ncbi:MAG: alpha-amylase family glycosyl hydrolase [Flavobacteriaceae bacterium]|nr:alpha-amylase family glycosyl hydrolase [Flavobacteriaceae bacterium]
MKKIIYAVSLLMLFAACKKEIAKVEEVNPVVTDEMMASAVIYEANIRQYSPEGTFQAFTKDIPMLKEMGVDIIWLMPIHEIGVKNRKGGLGSYYSIKDYRSVNHEFGTIEDFKNLVKTAHENGMYVILDWVGNHTAWDHAWVTEHPDFYTKDEKGNMIAPFDWTDVAELDYSNEALRTAMLEDMKYWVAELNVDGFRCDVAAEVPTDFWEKASNELQQIKPLFMLAEAEKPELLKKAFHMQYAWEGHHIFNQVAQGKKKVTEFDAYIAKMDTVLEKDDIMMHFVSNHDENSWNGTVKERMGESVELFMALSYTAPGMPLIYNGEEYDLNKRLRFFEKDTIVKEKGQFFDIYKQLNVLKKSTKALHTGKNKAEYVRLKTNNNDDVLAFLREKEGDKLLFIGNFTAKEMDVLVDADGSYKNYMTSNTEELNKATPIKLKAWEYKILVNK